MYYSVGLFSNFLQKKFKRSASVIKVSPASEPGLTTRAVNVVPRQEESLEDISEELSTPVLEVSVQGAQVGQ